MVILIPRKIGVSVYPLQESISIKILHMPQQHIYRAMSKFHSDHFIPTWMGADCNFLWFWIRMDNAFMKWAPEQTGPFYKYHILLYLQDIICWYVYSWLMFPQGTNNMCHLLKGIGDVSFPKPNIDGLVQERRNSIANELELRLSCTNPSILHSSLKHICVVRLHSVKNIDVVDCTSLTSTRVLLQGFQFHILSTIMFVEYHQALLISSIQALILSQTTRPEI